MKLQNKEVFSAEEFGFVKEMLVYPGWSKKKNGDGEGLQSCETAV